MDQAKQDLAKYTAAAQTILYEPSRAGPLLKMMSSTDGAINAVRTVIGVMEQQSDIPPATELLLGPIILMLLVDLAKAAYGKTPNPKMLDAAVKQLMSETGGRLTEPQESPEQEQAEPVQEPMAQEQAEPQGIIQGAMR